MTFLTLADFKVTGNSVLRIAGLCADDPRYPKLLDEAVRRLMKRGDWAQTVVPIHVCIQRGCVTFPRYVGSVRKINLCGTPVPVTNIWASYLDRDLWPRWYDFPGFGSWGQLGSLYDVPGYSYGYGNSLRYSFVGATKVGYYSTYNDPFGSPRFIRAYPQFPEDIGKTVTIFGRDENGQPLVTKNTATDGTVTYTPGVIITLASPYGSTSVQVQGPLERVIKDATQGQVFLYAYNATDDLLEDLAIYEPSETNPTYERFRIPGNSPSGSCTTSVMALVKLKHVPLQHDTDLVTVPDEDAIKTMVQAIRFEEANDAANANVFEARAIRELNLMLRDQYPENETPITIEPFNATGLGGQQCF